MIRKISRVFLVVLFAALGWFLGYLKAPHFEDTRMFWIGFVACMFLVACILILDFLYNSKDFNSSRKSRFQLGLLSVLVLLAASLPGIITSRIESNLRSQLETEQDRRKMEEAKRISSQMTGYMEGLGTLLARVDRDLSASNSRTLSDTTIDLVVAFNDQLNPYHIVTKDSITKAKYSPEKGQLLLQLAHRRIDSLSFAEIKSRTSFSSTYLPNANLDSTDLSGIDLSKSFLPYCSFSSTSMSSANFHSSTLTASSFVYSVLENANLSRTFCAMSHFEKCSITNTLLVSANLSFASVQNSVLDSCSLILAKLEHGFIQSAELRECNFEWVDLTNCVFVSVKIKNGSFLKTKFIQTSFDRVDVDSISVVPNFIKELKPRHLIQAKNFTLNHRCTRDSSSGHFILTRIVSPAL